MDRNQQRQQRRDSTDAFSCTSGASLPPIINPAPRPSIACEPSNPSPTALPFVSLTACPPPDPIPLNLPDGLLVKSSTAEAYCPSTAGYSVTGTTAVSLSAGDQTVLVIFTVIDNISENQLNYLYQVVPASSAAIISASLSGATSSVIDLTHLNYGQSEQLIGLVQDAKFTVDTLAIEKARNLLFCQAENNLQSALCPTSAYFGPTAALPPTLPYTPSATSVTGSVLVPFELTPTSGGQTAFAALNVANLIAATEEADAIALAQAESLLRCVYANSATAASCCTADVPGNNLGYQFCVPATGPSIPGSATAIGYFAVEADTLFSIVSKSEADALAREVARDALNCYFPSDEITATCEGLGLTAPFAPASTTTVTLPAGAIILSDLDSSVTAANTQAEIIAAASLNCFWSNAEVSATCPPSGTFTAINNFVYNLAASPTVSLNYTSTVPENTVISYESQADADEQAQQLALASLSCVYCNNSIAPTCSGGVNETVGASADLICNILPEIAQNTAISLGNILKSAADGGLNCCYGNDAVENTIFCGTGAYFSNSPTATFTSMDSFFLPANVITICESTTAPPPPPLLFSYSNLYETDDVNFGCCSDIYLCGGGSGSATALPVLWADQTNLFNAIATGATFYLDDEGLTVATFSPASTHIVSRSGSQRYYRGISGTAGYTEGLTACDACSDLTAYTFRGATLGGFSESSTSLALRDIFCNGPTAETVILYTNSANPFTSIFPTSWYTDPCGSSAFSPVASATTSAYYMAGYVVGTTGLNITFSTSGSNTALAGDVYSLNDCPLSRYSYSVYVNSVACNTGSGATTLYTSVPLAFTTNAGVTASFYTELFNDGSTFSYGGATGYITYVAPDTSVYSRPINGITAYPGFTCSDLFRVTVQYSATSADEVCNYPLYFSPTADGYFNSNILTLWSDIEDPFGIGSSGATATFYTAPTVNTAYLFIPDEASASVYLSEFSPGDKLRSVYREFVLPSTAAVYHTYGATLELSPFVISATGATEFDALWFHSNALDAICTGLTVGSKGLLIEGVTACESAVIYSDIKYPVTTQAALDVTLKHVPLPATPIDTLYSSTNNLLFDSFGYELASGFTGTVGTNVINVLDFTRIGAGFTGALIRTPGDYIGTTGAAETVIPPFIESIDLATGTINLGGYFNKVNSTIPANTPLQVVGFTISAIDWTSNTFSCTGPMCEHLEVGHSLYSYFVGAEGTTSSAGYITRIAANYAITYNAAPGYSNFAAHDTGTGASHGSGRVYVLGRQFAAFWRTADQENHVDKALDLESELYNYIYKNETTGYAAAKNLTLQPLNTMPGGYTVIGTNYGTCATSQNVPSSVTGALYWDGLNYAYDIFTFQCDGTVDIVTTPVPHITTAAFLSCCDTVAVEGATSSTASACTFTSVYPGQTADAASSYQAIDIVYALGSTTYHDNMTKDYIHPGSWGDNVIQVDGTGPFVRAAFLSGVYKSSYPCNAADIGSTATYSRRYVGYFSLSENIYPDDQGVTLDNELYWSGAGKNNVPSSTGYVFKELDPDLAAVTGCNCGNFSFINHDINSGVRYSIWPSASAAWDSLTNPPFIAPSDPYDPFVPVSLFNECATGCSETYSCVDNLSCDESAPAGFVSGIEDETIGAGGGPPPSFSSNFFNFEVMPSVGSSAETLKEQATELAQTLVNSFVRCFYFNEFQQGDPCSNPTDITVRIGFTNAGEVVSNLSLEDANQRAKQIADSRTICLSEDMVGAGCENTDISNANASNAIGAISLSFAKSGCQFTPSLSFNTSLQLFGGSVTKLTICSSTGLSQDIYVPDMGSGFNNQTINFAIEDPD